MKTFTKYLAAATAGYALHAYMKKDAQLTNDALTRSMNNHPSNHNRPLTSTVPLTFMERRMDHLARKFARWVLGDQSVKPSLVEFAHQKDVTYLADRPTNYNRFGRRGTI